MSKLQLLHTLSASGGYYPVASIGGPDARPNTLYRGRNMWLRPGGRLEPTKLTSQRNVQAVGSRIYALDQYRGTIAGGLVSSRLPKESLVRYLGGALFFVSENTSQQVYINESTSSPFTLTGVTTSSTASKLRVALLSGTTYTAYDAGLSPPSVGTVSTEAGGSKSMDGIVSIVACARRITTDTTSNPSAASVQTLTAAGNNRIRVALPALASGTDGWLYGGTAWGSGNYGPWKVIREIRSVLPGSSSTPIGATNGSPNITGTGTRFLRDLRAGDLVTISGSDYTISSVTSDTAAILTSNFSSATGSYAGTMKEIVLDWRNNELGELIDFDNDPPPLLDGLFLFNNTPFGWRGNTFYPTKIGNPEAFPAALARSTMSGSDIVFGIAGDGRIYLGTTNGLEVVTFTQNEADPFLIRQVWGFGFSSPVQAVVVEGTLYALVGTSSGVKAIRTRVDDSPDLEFGAAVESDMAGWDISKCVLAHDPTNGAVLFCHYDSTNTETVIIPYMLQQGVWSIPQTHGLTDGQQVAAAATANNACSFTVLESGSYTVYGFEASTVYPAGYVVWPFLDAEGVRMILKRLKFTGRGATLYVYAATPGGGIPDVTSTSAATASFTLPSTTGHDTQIQTSISNCQSYAVRVDTNNALFSATITEVNVYGLYNTISR